MVEVAAIENTLCAGKGSLAWKYESSQLSVRKDEAVVRKLEEPEKRRSSVVKYSAFLAFFISLSEDCQSFGRIP